MHASWPAGSDRRLPKRCMYPGALALYSELDIGFGLRLKVGCSAACALCKEQVPGQPCKLFVKLSVNICLSATAAMIRALPQPVDLSLASRGDCICSTSVALQAVLQDMLLLPFIMDSKLCCSLAVASPGLNSNGPCWCSAASSWSMRGGCASSLWTQRTSMGHPRQPRGSGCLTASGLACQQASGTWHP